MNKPNILLILADDMGFADLGCYGSEIRTPHLDALAAGGVRFSQMYNCARCCPSRAALLTGLYPHQAGVGAMVKNLGRPSYQGYLNDACVTFGEVLGQAGYATGYAGKWHTGGVWPRGDNGPARWRFDDPTHPTPFTRGFQRFYGNLAGGGSYFQPAAIVEQDRIVEQPDDFYTTDYYTTHAIAMMRAAHAAGRPFCTHVCYNAPHWPLHAWPADVERYRGVYGKGWDYFRTARHESLKGMGMLSARWPISPRDPDAPAWTDAPHRDWDALRMAAYAGMIECLDRNIGRLLDELRTMDAWENTWVIFLSDNGGCHEFLKPGAGAERELPRARDGRPVRFGNQPGLPPGSPDTFMSYDLPWANVSNTPFRLFKHWVHEGGIAAPCVMSWPARIKRSGITHAPAHIMDITASLIAAAGASYPESFNGRPIAPLEGEILLPLLDGLDWRRCRPMFWEHEGNRAVRRDQWKLVSRHNGPWELYDMTADRTELSDLVERYPDIVAELARLYGVWAERCGVMPWPLQSAG